MSLEAYIWAADLPLSTCTGTAFRVLLKLADRADKYGYGAYPSVAGIAEVLECSERTVYRGLAELQRLGLIRKGDQRYVDHIDVRYRPTVYDVLTPALKALESRGVIRVTPEQSRGDRNRHPGVTTGVSRTVLNPPTKTSSVSHVTSRERAYGRSA